ncbi:DNA cytosine methyltransferase [Elizabethkingia anophelis]|nr:DNA cytosine methyltransferase [Elizabethkingia anophelis]MCT4239404.1 DNA cytosine methyltransferase [Elizabethkingia anophelis]MCT4282025.1 DNA cytosine methyltransferase [Elizabethkingia anophelis]MCT4292610.1 DNA cytosine methyltransferase [Elizabethkingia anophelis]
MKILNLYAGIGGNRKLWGDEHEVTAVEYDEATAETYKKFFPGDKVFITDAHQFLMDNFREFDFIWSSPPCPTHSRINHAKTRRPDYADMRLYQEIIFLNHWFNGKYVVENVIPYYEPLIQAKKVDRHLWWSNFNITDFTPSKKPNHETAKIKDLEQFFDINLSEYKPKGKNSKLKMLRNMVHPETGLHILNCALNTVPKKAIHSLFDDSLIYL